ncbi:MAG: Conserved inner membrane protein [Candidatus Tokpelaia sp. JSC189]|nr:MAG: Conserved inner membrane protein [Candidatus Tokpelaia sp. JSC189]
MFELCLGNTVYPYIYAWADTGVNFAKNRLLRLGIVLFGLHLSFQDIAAIGLSAVVIDAIMLFGTFSMFLYPLLYQWNLQTNWITFSPQNYGVYLGSTVHEVAQVVVRLNSTLTNSIGGLMPYLLFLDEWLLTTAMFALGLTPHVSSIRKSDIHPIALAAVLEIWLLIGGLLINLAGRFWESIGRLITPLGHIDNIAG